MGYDLSTWDDVAVVRRSVSRTAPRQYALICQATGTTGIEALAQMVSEFQRGLTLLATADLARRVALTLPIALSLEWIRDQAIEA